MIWRVRERAALDRISRSGRRVQRGPLWARLLPDPDEQPPRVAFAISRRHGGAVQRNRLRRRLRAALWIADPPLPPGSYLVGARPDADQLSSGELTVAVTALIEAVRAQVPA